MKLKKLICTVLGAAMLFGAAYVPAYASWGVYDAYYGSQYNTESKTAMTDGMEKLRENYNDDDWNSLLYSVREDGTAMITGFYAETFYNAEKLRVELNVPSEIDGHTVTAIADGALNDRHTSAKIVGITLPPTIKEIGVQAIYGRYLKYLTLNDGLEVIKDVGIDCGDELETLVIPDSIKYIGHGAITGESLKNITLPKNLEFLGVDILSKSAYALDPANRVNNIMYHGQYLIAGKGDSLEDALDSDPFDVITDGKAIHAWDASGDVDIREGTTLMCEEAFAMTKIASVKIPSTLSSIPYLGFYWCENLNNVVIPSNIKVIGPNAFALCENLSNLTIEEGVEHIGEMAFFRCNSLNEVTIPKSVKQIDMHAFGWDYTDGYDVRNENFVIKCYNGTAAEQYAKDNGFKCILLDTGETIGKGEPTAAADARYVCSEKLENCAVKRFKDVRSADGDHNHFGIEFCLDAGIMAGTGADTFSPDDSITRAQFATMFYRFVGSPETSDNSVFTDLTQDWYKKPIAWAAANGVLNGTGNNTFSPDDVITREQIAAIFYRYAESKGLNMTVSESWREALKTDNDYAEIADYAKTAVEWCYEHHILFTYSLDGYAYSICPKAAPTRAETATLFYNFDYELNHS